MTAALRREVWRDCIPPSIGCPAGDKEKLQGRATRLSGGVAVIAVGAAPEPAKKERKARVEHALNATRGC